MRVEQLGEGTPEVAVVGAIHGDEPCGARAVERLLAEDPAVARPVKLVIANERALERNVRFVDVDLNRAFPGDPDASEHERRLAHALLEEIQDCTVVSMHSTQSHAGPFAIVRGVGDLARSICPELSVEAVVEAGVFTEGRLIAHHPRTIEVECGLQGSDRAADNASRLAREFLAAVGALADRTGGTGDRTGGTGEPRTRERGGLPVYRLIRLVGKRPADSYEVLAPNFERVAAGEAFAVAGGSELVAEAPFYPVLMSSYGYEDVFGYAAEFLGHLETDETEG